MIRYLFLEAIYSLNYLSYSSPSCLDLCGVILHEDLVDEVLPGEDDPRGPGEGGGALEEGVDLPGRLSALCDAPDNETLA